MALLITGGLGYIGSHTAVVFANAGYDVVLVDNLSNSKRSVLEHINSLTPKPLTFYHCDIGDQEALSKIFASHSLDAVIHFAAYKAVGESCEKPFVYYKNNIEGSLALFELMDRYNVKHIIFSSSATVYDQTCIPPFLETDRLGTTNPYATTKLVIEHLLHDLALHKGFRAVCLRYFNPIGAHPSGTIGEDPAGIPNNLLPYIFRVADGSLAKVSVFGNDYVTRDGTGVRDYIHVMDIAQAHILAYEKKGLPNFETFNIGTGEGSTVLEIIDLVQKITGKEIPYELAPRRPGDVAVLLPNPDKAKRILGREAIRTVEDAIHDGWKFIQGF